MQTERRREQDRARHARDKEKRNAARRTARAANPEHYRAMEKAAYLRDPTVKKRADTKHKFGPHAFSAYMSATHCESCGDAIAGKNKHIDHDHKKGPKSFRGILCNCCNIALGYLKEDERRITALASYINRKQRGKLI